MASFASASVSYLSTGRCAWTAEESWLSKPGKPASKIYKVKRQHVNTEWLDIDPSLGPSTMTLSQPILHQDHLARNLMIHPSRHKTLECVSGFFFFCRTLKASEGESHPWAKIKRWLRIGQVGVGRVDLAPMVHLAMSRDIFNCHTDG